MDNENFDPMKLKQDLIALEDKPTELVEYVNRLDHREKRIALSMMYDHFNRDTIYLLENEGIIAKLEAEFDTGASTDDAALLEQFRTSMEEDGFAGEAPLMPEHRGGEGQHEDPPSYEAATGEEEEPLPDTPTSPDPADRSEERDAEEDGDTESDDGPEERRYSYPLPSEKDPVMEDGEPDEEDETDEDRTETDSEEDTTADDEEDAKAASSEDRQENFFNEEEQTASSVGIPSIPVRIQLASTMAAALSDSPDRSVSSAVSSLQEETSKLAVRGVGNLSPDAPEAVSVAANDKEALAIATAEKSDKEVGGWGLRAITQKEVELAKDVRTQLAAVITAEKDIREEFYAVVREYKSVADTARENAVNAELLRNSMKDSVAHAKVFFDEDVNRMLRDQMESATSEFYSNAKENFNELLKTVVTRYKQFTEAAGRFEVENEREIRVIGKCTQSLEKKLDRLLLLFYGLIVLGVLNLVVQIAFHFIG